MVTVRRTKALVAEDHELFRLGLASLLRHRCGFEQVIEATGFDDALEKLGQCGVVTFATFDLDMPGMKGVADLGAVRRIFPQLAIVVVTASGRRDDIIAALVAGASGFVPKTLGTAEIGDALDAVLDGVVYVPWSVTVLSPGVGDALPPDERAVSDVRLTVRQQDVLRLIRAGMSNKAIAARLGLTESTVKVHANALYRALGVRTRAEAASSHASPI